MGMAASAEDLMEATLFTAVAGDILLPTSFTYTLNDLFIWLHQVLAAACGMEIPNQGPCVGSSKSLPLDHWGSSLYLFINLKISSEIPPSHGFVRVILKHHQGLLLQKWGTHLVGGLQNKGESE